MNRIGIPRPEDVDVDLDYGKITYEDQLRISEEIKQWRFDPNGNLIMTNLETES